MCDVVVATGIHAAGNVQLNFAQIMQIIPVVKARLNLIGNRNRARVGQ